MAKEYIISKTDGQCRSCRKRMQPGEEFVATVREVDEGFHREDFCLPCWDAAPREEPATFGVWRSRVPRPQEKKKLLIDDELLISFFERLSGVDSPAKIDFRFVLALVLMRKKLLVYDRMDKLPDGREVWKMHFKGGTQTHEVINPHMDEENIAEVSRHLGEIMEGQL